MARPLPADVYLDTSVVVAAIIAGTPHSAASSAFYLGLAEQGSRVYFSQLLRLEYGEAIRRLVRRDQLPDDLRRRYDLARWDADVAVRRRWMRFGVDQLTAFLDQFAEVSELPFDLRVWEQSIDIMAVAHLRSYDAIHVATAQDAGVRDLATLDEHFNRVDGLEVWLLTG